MVIRFIVTIFFAIFSIFASGDLSLGSTDRSETPPFSELSAYYRELSPEKEQSVTTINILKNLRQRHYKRLRIDDSLSSKLFDRYINDLDSSKVYFTSNDIKEFERFRYRFDDAIKKGDLKPAFAIFNRYQKRVAERLLFMKERISCCIDRIILTADESYETDREKLPWPVSSGKMDAIWQKRLKNEVLNLKLSDQPPADIGATLKKKYISKLNRLRRTKSEDAFNIFINAFTQSYDPHTQYFSPRGSEDFNIRMSLSLEGIGALLQMENEHTKVVRLIHGGPAEKSKLLKPGDRIIGVGQGENGEIVDVVGWRLDDVVQLIRGRKGTVVKLRIIPAAASDPNATRLISITRNTVKLEEQAASSKVKEVVHEGETYKIGIIKIPTFYVDFSALQARAPNYKSTTRDVKKLLDQLKKEGVDGIIIDLRDNGGGALQEATSLTGLFIEKGPTVIVKGAGNHTSVYPDPDPGIYYTGPLAVLVNRMSASASEIFAGAIRDHKRGIILGSQTFGKGTVQSLLNLNQGQLKLTIAKFYRISGESTQNKGIIPDIIYPSIYNLEKTGESSLPEALPWDTIGAQNFQAFTDINFSSIVEQLQARHNKRIKTSPDFSYLVEYNNYYKDERKKTRISLNEKKRIEERKRIELWQLDLENRLRKSRGQTPFRNYEELKNSLRENEEDQNSGRDTLMDESEHILIDYLKLTHSSIATR